MILLGTEIICRHILFIITVEIVGGKRQFSNQHLIMVSDEVKPL